MFGSEMLEVAIGLIFIYILLSLFCTTATEFVARLLALRSTTLEEGIRNLLCITESVAKTNDSLDSKSEGEKQGEEKKHDDEVSLNDFFQNPLIAKLGLGQRALKKKGVFILQGYPSYISSSYFATALYDTLFPVDRNPPKDIKEARMRIDQTKGLPPETKRPLLVFLDKADGAENELKEFQKEIESWFEELMARVNGWYTRKAQLIIILIAIVVACIFNADTLMVANILVRNATLRDAVVSAAGQIDVNDQDSVRDLDELQTELLGTGILGWSRSSENYEDPREWPTDPVDWIYKIVGLALTAGLVSLGAPFWFDILNKTINVRATGKPPIPKKIG